MPPIGRSTSAISPAMAAATSISISIRCGRHRRSTPLVLIFTGHLPIGAMAQPTSTIWPVRARPMTLPICARTCAAARALVGTMPAKLIATAKFAQPLPMGRASPGCIAIRIFCRGGRTLITIALRALKAARRQRGYRNPSRFGLWKPAARASTRVPTSPMCLSIPRVRNRSCRIIRAARVMI